MRRFLATAPTTTGLAFFALALLVSGGSLANAQQTVGGTLSGYKEVPSISSTGTGTFLAVIQADNASINYQLTYSNLSSAVMFAHIHIAQPGVNGGVMVFLCGGGNKPACPASGTVSGTITAADVQAVSTQGIDAGSLDEVLAAIRAGASYANVHTATYPSGEMRTQIRMVSTGTIAK